MLQVYQCNSTDMPNIILLQVLLLLQLLRLLIWLLQYLREMLIPLPLDRWSESLSLNLLWQALVSPRCCLETRTEINDISTSLSSETIYATLNIIAEGPFDRAEMFGLYYLLLTALMRQKIAIASIGPSVRLSVHLSVRPFVSSLSSEPTGC